MITVTLTYFPVLQRRIENVSAYCISQGTKVYNIFFSFLREVGRERQELGAVLYVP